MARQRRKFTKRCSFGEYSPNRERTREFKLETVKLVKAGPRSISQVAQDLDLTESALRNWVRQYDIDTGNRQGKTTAEHQELQRLRAENR
ncbi:MAG: transposase, partial [Cyanobacteria bacterium J06641_5]